MESTKENGFKQWAILELMGHRRLAGLVSETTLAGGAFLRIDVPSPCTGISATWCPRCGDCKCPRPAEAKDDPSCPLHHPGSEHGESIVATQFYSPSSVYCLTPTTEELARKVAAGVQPGPITEWDLPKPPKAIGGRRHDESDDDEADDGPDDDRPF